MEVCGTEFGAASIDLGHGESLVIVDNQGRLLGFAALAAMIAFISCGMYASRLYIRKRRRAMTEAGAALGFISIPEEEVRLPGLRLLTGKGSWANYSSTMKGLIVGYETLIFDFCYVTGFGKTTRGVNQTVAAFHLLGANMPDFQIAPKTLEDKVDSLFGAKASIVKDHPNFVSRYIATGADLESASPVFTPALLGFFESRTNKTLTVEGYWEWIIVYRPGHRVKPSELEGFLAGTSQIATGLLGQIPKALVGASSASDQRR
jgi:hypothetical protein